MDGGDLLDCGGVFVGGGGFPLTSVKRSSLKSPFLLRCRLSIDGDEVSGR